MTTAAISLSTHVLDTGAGKPADGVLVVLYRGDMFMAEMRTDADGRAQLSDDLDPGTVPARLPPGISVLQARRA